MSLTTNLDLQEKAQQGKYAVGASNTSNLEITQAILEAAGEHRSPVIVATSQSHQVRRYRGALGDGSHPDPAA